MEVNSLKKIAILLIVCVATVMSGCDSDVRLLDTVPADAAAVVAVNAVRLNEELDGVRNGGKLTADETLRSPACQQYRPCKEADKDHVDVDGG